MSSTARTWSGGSDDRTSAPPFPDGNGNGHAYSPDVSPVGAGSIACGRCGAGMDPDQRYCIECGERRGKPRFTAGALTPGPSAGATWPSAQPPARRRPRMSASGSTTLIAGIATLLLALGVGVLIGEDNSPAPAAQRAQVITVQGAATQASAPTTSTPVQSTQVAASSSGSQAKRAKSAKAANTTTTTSATTTAAAKAANSAAANNAANKAAASTLGSSNVGNVASQPGSSCAAGTPGCEHGKQTDQLFGGG